MTNAWGFVQCPSCDLPNCTHGVERELADLRAKESERRRLMKKLCDSFDQFLADWIDFNGAMTS